MGSLTAFYVRWRYAILLGTLVLVLVVQPVSFGLSMAPPLFDACLLLVTVVLLISFCPDKNRRLAAIAFGGPACLRFLVGQLLAGQPRDTAIIIGHGWAVLLYFWGAVVIVASLIRRQALSLDSVFGAICGYLLLGMAWGVLYSMLDTASPGSFDVGSRLAEQVHADHSHIPLFTYYSFVTLTTVGYGDVTPVSTPARTCAWLEALTGQFYLAVLVAGLVGAMLAERTDANRTAGPGPPGPPLAS
jgi:hypothetical protein